MAGKYSSTLDLCVTINIYCNCFLWRNASNNMRAASLLWGKSVQQTHSLHINCQRNGRHTYLTAESPRKWRSL